MPKQGIEVIQVTTKSQAKQRLAYYKWYHRLTFSEAINKLMDQEGIKIPEK